MRKTFDLFSDYFSRRDNALRRLDVRAKLGVAVVLFAAVLCSTRVPLPLAVCGLAAATLFALRIPRRIIASRFLPALAGALAIVVLQALFVGGAPVFSATLGAWTLRPTREGIAVGALLGSRVLGAVGVLLMFSSVTPAHELFLALRVCRLPAVWVEIAMLMYRYLFVFLDDACDLVDAQRVRLGYARFGTALSSAGGLVGAVLVRSIEQSFRTHEAMVARGYTGEYPFGVMPAMAPKAVVTMLGVAAGIAAVFVLAERGLS